VKRVMMRLLVMMVLLISLYVGISCAEEEAISWQGHALSVERITTEYNDISKVLSGPTPAIGYHVLFLLRATDGSTIAQADADQYGRDFILHDGVNNSMRPSSVILDHEGYDLGILFYVSASSADAATLRLDVEEQARTPDHIAAAKLSWQGLGLSVSDWTIDKATLSQYTWPENGYWAAAVFRTQDIPITAAQFEMGQYEIVLADDSGREYICSDSWMSSEMNKPTAFRLIYMIDGDAPPPPELLSFRVRPLKILWFDADARSKSAVPFSLFKPEQPEAKTFALALDNAAQYRYNARAAAGNPEAAFKELEQELSLIESDLSAMFSDAITLTKAPSRASVLVFINIQYQKGARYGIAGEVSSYGCVMTLTAYDALTHAQIAVMQLEKHFGDTISVTQGTSLVVQNVPRIADATQEQKTMFLVPLLEALQTR